MISIYVLIIILFLHNISTGELDKSELKNLMAKMGIEVSEKRLTELMNQYDVDQGGKVCVYICCFLVLCILFIVTDARTSFLEMLQEDYNF
jgi:Ca2+-binding EF-hand superfamily protein